jgi:hypothetical protein
MLEHEPVIWRFLLRARQLILSFVFKGFGAAVIVLQVCGATIRNLYARATKVYGNSCRPDPVFWYSDLQCVFVFVM